MKNLFFVLLFLITGWQNTFAQYYKELLDSAEIYYHNEKYFEAYERYKAAKVFGKKLPNTVAQSEAGMEKAVVGIKKQKRMSDSLFNVAKEEERNVKLISDSISFYLYLFNGKQIANQSLLMEKNDTLKAILAIQSFDLIRFGNKNYFNDTISLQKETIEALQSAWSIFFPDTLRSKATNFVIYDDKFIFIDENGNLLIQNQIIDNQEWLNIIYKYKDFIIGGTLDGKIINYSHEKKILYQNRNKVTSIKIDSTGNQLITSFLDDKEPIIIYNFKKNEKLAIKYPNPIISTVLIESKLIIGSDLKGRILVWNADSLLKNPTILYENLNENNFYKLTYNNELKLLVASCSSKLLIFNYINDKLDLNYILNTKQRGPVTFLDFSNDSKWMGCSSLDGKILIMDFSNYKMEKVDYLPYYYINTNYSKICDFSFSNSNNNSHFIYFCDEKGLHYRNLNIIQVYTELKDKIKNKRLSKKEWNFYIQGLNYNFN